ncbi:MAG: TraR/DksA C4-type zinc finger protein [Pseudonocardiales bacterium]
MAVLDQARRTQAQIEQALDRLDRGVYGTCERCGRPISAERLDARPSTSTCICCAT